MPDIEVKGLDELRAKFKQYPRVFDKAMNKTMQAALLMVWSKVPAYPPKPAGSWYKRTGTLGRTLGVSEAGHKLGGKPDIYINKKIGTHGLDRVGVFGTRLHYASRVIGDPYFEQHEPWSWYWWNLPISVATSAARPVVQLFEAMGGALARWLNNEAGEP